jgi:hypothetical protein
VLVLYHCYFQLSKCSVISWNYQILSMRHSCIMSFCFAMARLVGFESYGITAPSPEFALARGDPTCRLDFKRLFLHRCTSPRQSSWWWWLRRGGGDDGSVDLACRVRAVGLTCRGSRLARCGGGKRRGGGDCSAAHIVILQLHGLHS